MESGMKNKLEELIIVEKHTVLTDGTKIPLIWDGTQWAVVDYRKYKSVGEYKDAVDATGSRFGIHCAWPLSTLMRKNPLTFSEAFELFTVGYEKAAAQRGTYRRKGGKVTRKPERTNSTLSGTATAGK
jgi:hypothetical protein